MDVRSRCVVAAAVVGLAGVSCGSSNAVERAGAPGCGETSGELVEVDIESLPQWSDRVVVHLPPCYSSSDARYPVAYLLHGAGMRPDQWFGDGWGEAGIEADRGAVAGDFDPMILVAPSGTAGRQSFWTDDYWVVVDAIDEQFRTIAEPGARAVGGISAGGAPAAYIAVDERAGDIAALGLFMTVWGDNVQRDVVAGLAATGHSPEVLIEIGENDRLGQYTDDIVDVFLDAGITAEAPVLPGAHDRSFVSARTPTWIAWFGERLSS